MTDVECKKAQEWVLQQIETIGKQSKYNGGKKFYLWFQVKHRIEKLMLATKHLDEAFPEAKKGQLSLTVRLWALSNGYLTIDSLPKCSVCNEKYAILSYKKKDKSISFSEACGRKCSQKILGKKQSSKEFKEKKKATAIKNYGSEKAAYIDTMTETVKAKYGVDNISQSHTIKQKKIETSQERYGTDYPWQTAEGKLAQKRGVQQKYGVDNVSKIPNIKDKKIETTQQHFGVDNPFQAEEVKEKIKQTNLEQFGVENPAQRESRRQELSENILAHRKHSDNLSAWGYSKKACRIIQQFNDLWGYNFQHAENGGEFCIPAAHYFVDGYDHERNIVLEIDEKHHFINGKLKNDDIERQKEIQSIMKCKFIRIRIF